MRGLPRRRGHRPPLDEADRGRLIDCPVLVLWGTRGALEIFYGDVLAVWRAWARDPRGRGLDASHFLVEDAPEQVAQELTEFFSEDSYRRRDRARS
jgi:haloacetate dehalogenase